MFVLGPPVRSGFRVNVTLSLGLAVMVKVSMCLKYMTYDIVYFFTCANKSHERNKAISLFELTVIHDLFVLSVALRSKQKFSHKKLKSIKTGTLLLYGVIF